MPARLHSVMLACSTSGTSIGSLLKNLMTQGSPPICTRAFGFAPPKLPPVLIMRRSSSLIGSLALTLATTSLSVCASASLGNGPLRRGR